MRLSRPAITNSNNKYQKRSNISSATLVHFTTSFLAIRPQTYFRCQSLTVWNAGMHELNCKIVSIDFTFNITVRINVCKLLCDVYSILNKDYKLLYFQYLVLM
jgi:hypothetical protein